MTYRNEKIWHLAFVLLPRFPILGLTLFDISVRPVTDHDGKEDRVKPWQRAVEARDESPHDCEVHVGRVMDLAGVPICTR